MEISYDGKIRKYQGNLIAIATIKDFNDEEIEKHKSRTLSGVPSLYHDSFNRKRTSK